MLLHHRCRGLVHALAGIALAVTSLPIAASSLRVAHDAEPQWEATKNTANAAARVQISMQRPDGQRMVIALQPQTALMSDTVRRRLRETHGTHVFAGHVIGSDDSWVRLTRIDGAWMGAICTPTELWLLDPARDHDDSADALDLESNATLIYTQADLTTPLPYDADLLLPATTTRPAAAAAAAAGTEALTYEIELTLVLDPQFQTHYGADSESVALAVANVVDGFYAAQLDTRVRLDDIILMADDGGMVNDQGNPTTAAGALLGQFRQYTLRENVPYKDGIHLLSGRDFDGAVVGMAFSGAMCDFTHSAGVAQATSGGANAAIILAHELGHTAGLAHDSGAMGTACPAWGYIIGGMTSAAHSFSPCSIDQYHAWIASHNHACMRPVAVFADGFDDVNR